MVSTALQELGFEDGSSDSGGKLSDTCYALMHDRVALQLKDSALDWSLSAKCARDRDRLCPSHSWVGARGVGRSISDAVAYVVYTCAGRTICLSIFAAFIAVRELRNSAKNFPDSAGL